MIGKGKNRFSSNYFRLLYMRRFLFCMKSVEITKRIYGKPSGGAGKGGKNHGRRWGEPTNFHLIVEITFAFIVKHISLIYLFIIVDVYIPCYKFGQN